MKMFKWLFKRKKSPLTYLGRGGIKYNDGVHEYYIESDNLLPRENGSSGVCIFYKGTKMYGDSPPLSDEEKWRIANVVKNLIDQNGMHTEINTAG